MQVQREPAGDIHVVCPDWPNWLTSPTFETPGGLGYLWLPRQASLLIYESALRCTQFTGIVEIDQWAMFLPYVLGRAGLGYQTVAGAARALALPPPEGAPASLGLRTPAGERARRIERAVRALARRLAARAADLDGEATAARLAALRPDARAAGGIRR